ncbi:MAG: hypothetical protein U0353_29160 [Sandaracinus sp.]
MGAALVEVEASEPMFARARAHAAKVEDMLVSDDMVRKEHSELEEMLHAQGREWARLMYEENLRLRAQLEQRKGVTGADGVERTIVRDSERQLETLVGRVPVQRLAYREPGSEDLHPPEMGKWGNGEMARSEHGRDSAVEVTRSAPGHPCLRSPDASERPLETSTTRIPRLTASHADGTRLPRSARWPAGTLLPSRFARAGLS